MSESFFQQLWIKVQCKKLKSFMLCTVYIRPPSTPINFLEDLNINFMDSLLLGLDVIFLGDLNCNLLGNCSDGQVLDVCATTNLVQLVQDPTRITKTSQSLIDVALTTNENIIYSCKVKSSTISDHNLISLALKLQPPKKSLTYISTRSYNNYYSLKFADDLAHAPFHMINFFDDFDDKVHAYNCLFTDVLNIHAPVKLTKIKTRPNPSITPEIKHVMNTRDLWRKQLTQWVNFTGMPIASLGKK